MKGGRKKVRYTDAYVLAKAKFREYSLSLVAVSQRTSRYEGKYRLILTKRIPGPHIFHDESFCYIVSLYRIQKSQNKKFLAITFSRGKWSQKLLKL